MKGEGGEVMSGKGGEGDGTRMRRDGMGANGREGI